MPYTPLKQSLGSTRSWKVTAQANGKPMTNVFGDVDVLDAKVYRGDSQATLFTPDVSWIDSAAATIRLTVRSEVLSGANITPGQYRIEVGVTPTSDGHRRVVHYGSIQLVGTSGSASAPGTIASWSDMLTYCSDVQKLEQNDVDQTQFAGQRSEAMGLFVEEIVRRYNPRPGGSRRYVAADGVSAGPYLTFAPSPDGSPPPSRGAIKAWLAEGGRLALNRDVIEANARYAAALVYGYSPGSSNPYQQMSDKERGLARAATNRAVIEIDTKVTPDGNPTIRIDRDVIYLT